MTATPHLLETYEEARFLLAAKGWGLEKAGKELAEKPELKRFGLSQPTFSKKTKPGSKIPIEPEVAAAVESLKTWIGYERQAEIATRGLLALHGAARGEDVGQLVKEMRKRLPGEIALKVIEALEKKAGARESKLIDTLDERASARESRILQEVGRLGQLSRRHVAICAGVGAVVVVAVLVAALLARAATSAAPHILIVPRVESGPALWAEAESFLAMSEWGEKRPLDQEVPNQTLPRQKVAPCDEGLGQVAINGNCWANMGDVKPPCGRLFRHANKCYAPVLAAPWPAEPGPAR